MVRLAIALFVILPVFWAIAAVVGMSYGALVAWPDYVHVNYGFPVTYAVHTLDTIAGPVDRWNMDPSALVVDLSFWFVCSALIVIGLLYYYHYASGRKERTRLGTKMDSLLTR